ncbi:helix-turn-helix transcriptional regulator [Streptococcus parauberis]|uniref:helix-turn-helix transcriptional regulator n=1 Tax=Streptococcus parauberis TaxID=1348 RepID=UPI000E301C6C|nr:helix-turn-helix transcriptional regulator [Streptococcus parauberis]RFE01157.1 helix-turn-helix protein [Streptococcus parauberis]
MNRIKELREKENISQEKLAKEIGVNLRTLQRWEAEESQIRKKNASILANRFKVSVPYLLGFKEFHFGENIKNLRRMSHSSLNEVSTFFEIPQKDWLILESIKEPIKDDDFLDKLSKYFSVDKDFLLGKTDVLNSKALLKHYEENRELYNYVPTDEEIERLLLESNKITGLSTENGKREFENLVSTEVKNKFEEEILNLFIDRSETDDTILDPDKWRKKWLNEFYESFEKATPPIRLILARYYAIPKDKREAVDLLLEMQSKPYIKDDGQLIDKYRGTVHIEED